MSSGNTVDSKIVELSFDNQNFESNATKSLSTLERLKTALNFSKDTSSFDEISKSAGKVNVDGLRNGIDGIHMSLSNLAKVGVFRIISDEMANLEQQAKQVIASISGIEGAKEGWSKYATKTESVQTIMAATSKEIADTGERMEYVNEQLEKLNWFTDETSFSFTDMTNNIGKFTSNNVGLEQSVTAMEGISTWAARSGAKVEEAGRAMYNLSQAIAVGSVKLMDWKSIENANMATAEFKETAIQTAVELGTLTEAGEGLYKTLEGHEVSVQNFNENLKDEWFSSEVLLGTLEKYGEFTDKLHGYIEQLGGDISATDMLGYIDEFKKGTLDLEEVAKDAEVPVSLLKRALTELSDESLDFGRQAFQAAQEAKTFGEAVEATRDAVSTGWMNTWEIIFGDYEHSKKLWTNVANDLWAIFASGGEARNDYLEEAFKTEAAITKEDLDQLTEAGIMSPEYIRALRNAAEEHESFYENVSDDEWVLNDAIRKGILTLDDLEKAYDNTFGKTGETVNENLKEQVNTLKDSDDEFKNLFDILDKNKDADVSSIVFGDDEYAAGAEELEGALDGMLKKLNLSQDSGEELVTVLKDMGYFGGLASDELDETAESQKEVFDAMRETHMSGQEAFAGGIDNTLNILINLLDTFREAWGETFDGLSAGGLNDILHGFYEGTKRVREFTKENEQLKFIFTAIASVANLVVNGLAGIFSIVGKLASIGVSAFMKIATFISNIAVAAVQWFEKMDLINKATTFVNDKIEKFANAVSNAVDAIGKWIVKSAIIEKATGFLSDKFNKASTAVKKWWDSFKSMPIITNNVTKFKEAFGMFLGNFNGLTKRAEVGFNKFKSSLAEKKANGEQIGIIDTLKLFKDNVVDYFFNFKGFTKLKEAFANLKADIKEALTSAGIDIDGIKEKLKPFSDIFGNAFDSAVSWFKSLPGVAKTAIDSFKNLPVVSKAIEKVKKEFSKDENGKIPFVEKLVTAKNKLSDFISKAKDILSGGISFDSIISVFQLFGQTIADIFSFDTVIPKIKEFGKSILSHFMNLDAFDKIKDALGNFVKEVVKLFTDFQGFDGILDAAKSVGKSVSDLFSGTDFASGVTNALSGFKEKIVGFLNDHGVNVDGLVDAFNRIKEAIVSIIDGIDIPTSFSELFETLFGITAEAAEVEDAGEDVGESGDSLKNGFEKLKEALDMAVEASGPIKKLIDVFGKPLLIFIGFISGIKIAKGAVNKIISSIGNVILGFKNILDSIAEDNKASAKLKKAKAMAITILSVVASVLLIVVALKQIETLDPKKLPQTLGILGGIMAALIVMIILMNKFGGTNTLHSGGGILAAVLSMVLLIGLLKILENDIFDMKKFETMAKNFGIVIAALAVVMLATKALGKNAAGSATAILASVAALAAMVILIKLISMMKEEELHKGITVIGLLTFFLGALMYCCQYASGAAKPIAALAVLLVAVVAAFLIISNIPTDKLIATTAALFLVIGALTAFSALTGALKPSIAAVGMMIALLAVVAICLGILASIPNTDQLLPIAIGISLVLAALAVAVAVASLAGANPIGAVIGIVMMGVMLAAFIGVALLLSKIKEETLNKIMKGLDILCQIGEKIGRFFGNIVSGLTAGATTDLAEIGENLVAFAKALEPLGDIKLSLFDFGKLFGIIAAVGASVSIGFMDGLGSIVTEFSTGMTTVELFTYDLNLLADAFLSWQEKTGELSGIKIHVFTVAGLGLDVLLASFTGLIDGVLSFITEASTGMTSVELFTYDLELLSGAMLNWDKITSQIDGIEVDFGGFLKLAAVDIISSVTGAISGIASFVTEAAEGVSAVGLFSQDITILAATLLVWDAVSSQIGGIEVDFSGFLKLAAVDVISSVTGAISGIASFITEAAEGVSAVEQFSSDITTLAGALLAWDAVGSEIGGIEVDFSGFLKLAAVDVISSVTGAISGIASFVTEAEEGVSAVGQFSSDITTLAGAMLVWDVIMNEIDGITVDFSAIGELAGIVAVADLSGVGSAISNAVTGWIEGDGDGDAIGNFTKALEDIGTAVTDWKTAMDGIGGENGVDLNTEAVSDLIDIVNKIELTSLKEAVSEKVRSMLGLKGQMEGFKDNVELLGDAVSGWAEKMNALGGENGVKIDTTGLTELVAAVNAVPKGGGLFEAITNFFEGATDMQSFADNLKTLGQGVADFTTALGEDFDTEKLTSAASAAKVLGELGTAIKGQDFGGWFHEGDMSLFGGELVTLGEKLGEFSNAEVNLESLESLTKSAKRLGDFSKAIQEADITDAKITSLGTALGKLKDAVQDANDIHLTGDIVNTILVNRFKRNVATMIEAIESAAESKPDVSGFVDAIDEINNAAINNAQQSVNSAEVDTSAISDGITNAAETALNGISDTEINVDLSSQGSAISESLAAGIEGSMTLIATAIATAIDNAKTTASTLADTFDSIGSAIDTDIASGITTNGSTVTGAVNTTLTNAKDNASVPDFTSIGTAISNGIAQGIRDGKSTITTAVNSVCSAAESTARQKLGVNSPSKVFAVIGSSIDEGFALGVTSNTYMVKRSIGTMKDAAVNGFRNVADTIKDILSADIDSDPVIRPVLDLSAMRYGSDKLNSMFGNKAIAVNGNLGYISNAMNSRSVTTNKDILDALENLGNKLGASGAGNTYNINGITYDDGSNVSSAVRELIRATRMERRM